MVTVRRRSRLAVGVQDELVKHFVAGATARSAAALVGVNRHTATLFFHKLRELISARLEAAAPELAAAFLGMNSTPALNRNSLPETNCHS
jgi:transposase